MIILTEEQLNQTAPLYSRVLVEEIKPKSKAGIHLEHIESNKRETILAKVIKTGTGVYEKDGRLRPLTVRVGDTVILQKFTGDIVKAEGRELLMVDEGHILATIGYK